MDQTAKPKTILVVDDDQDFLMQMDLQLRAAGFGVVLAGSLREARQALDRRTPDLVLTDRMMESVDAGLDLCHEVKTAVPGTPVILVTSAYQDMGLRREEPGQAGRLPADAVLAKPLRAEALRREIRRLLGS